MKKNTSNCTLIVENEKQYYSQAGKLPYFPLAVKSGHGATIIDQDDNSYIDFLSSAAMLNTGISHPKIVDVVTKQAQEFIHYIFPYIYHEPSVTLAKKLTEITPGSFEKKVIFGLSGSDANDGMIKFARAFTGKPKIISFIGSYHGSTFGAISLSAISLNMKRKIGPLLPDIHHINYPNCYRCRFSNNCDTCSLQCLNELEDAFKYYLPTDEVAAIVIEPIAGDAGMIVPPKKYMERLFALCKENNILFVVDEIQQGFGRTGKWFGIDHFDIEPDIMVLGKSIASGLPMSAIVGRKEIMESLDAPAHTFTGAGNPMACKASLATIEIINDENLISKANIHGEHIMKKFEIMKEKYDIIGDVRGLGLSIGVELITSKVNKDANNIAASKICYRAWEKGVLITFISQNVLRIQPPLVISNDEIDRALKIIEESIIEFLNGDIPDEVLETSTGW